MGFIKKKMLLAPVLAVTLALLLAGTVSIFPQSILQNQSTPPPTSTSTSPGTTTHIAASPTGNDAMITIFFGVATLLVAIVAAFLFFSEKKLKDIT